MKTLIVSNEEFVSEHLIVDLLLKKEEVVFLTRNTSSLMKNLPIQFLSSTNGIGDVLESVDRVIYILAPSFCIKQNNKMFDIELEFVSNLSKRIPKGVDVRVLESARVFKSSSLPNTVYSPRSKNKLGRLSEQIAELFSSHQLSIYRAPLILHRSSPLIQKLKVFFRFKLAPSIKSLGSLSWVHLDDLLKIITSEQRVGVNNIVAGVVSFKEFKERFASYCERSCWIWLPRFLVKFLLGERFDYLLGNFEVTPSVNRSDFNIVTLDLAFKEVCEFVKSPTLNEEKFHYSYDMVQFVPRSLEEVFEFFCEAKNLESITPAQLNFKITSQSTEKIQEGTRFTYKLKLYGVRFGWTTFIENWNPPHQFTDYQTKGPYNVWYHTHSFTSINGGTLMFDNVKYRLPFGILGEAVALLFVNKNIKDIFNYRYNYIKGLMK